MSDYKQCCIECRFHFFDEDECPACDAYQAGKEYEAEWDRQLRLLELYSGITCNDDFWALWHANRVQIKNWFRTMCQNLAPEIYDWYTGLDLEEMSAEQYMTEQQQLNLFEEQLPF